MAESVIVMPAHQNLERDVLAIGRRLLPPGFQLDVVEPAALAGRSARPTSCWGSWGA